MACLRVAKAMREDKAESEAVGVSSVVVRLAMFFSATNNQRRRAFVQQS
jgi:hypothetical protein